MGREVRRVPADWQHPKHWTRGLHGMEERYKPLFPGERYQHDAEHRAMCYEQYAGQRPHRDDYMPNWPDSERTHLMMYEDTSEGTPISPAFATPEELARWLVDNNASAFGDSTGSYEGWLRVARGGCAPSMVATAAGLTSGVDAL